MAPGHCGDDRARRVPAKAGRARQDENRIIAIAAHQPVDHLDRHAADRRQRGDGLFVLAGFGIFDNVFLAERALVVANAHHCHCVGIAARRRLGADLVGDQCAALCEFPKLSRAWRAPADAAARPPSPGSATAGTDAAEYRFASRLSPRARHPAARASPDWRTHCRTIGLAGWRQRCARRFDRRAQAGPRRAPR